MKHLKTSLLAILLALAVPVLLSADPPSVVGRLSLASGDVSFRPGSMDDWAPAVINYPLTAGDDLWVDDGGRAEIHVGSTALRVGPNSSISFLNLDDDTVQVSLSDGSLGISVRRPLEGVDVVEIDTPNAVYTIIRPGSYRVNVGLDDSTSVAVRSGAVVVTTAGENFAVNAGQTGNVSGTESVAYYVEQAVRTDFFDSWCASREAREDRSVSLRYVSREMIGVQDLDEAGSWIVVAGYGTVWTPSGVPVGWAPYRHGHWAWVSPWGWTWIDDAPWGFAPFHYGRWAYVGTRWVWVPGAVVARPVYAPALVVFIGGDGDSVDTVTWFPLAPREVYVPSYVVSTVYMRRINIDHGPSVQEIERANPRQAAYANRRAPQAVTMVPRHAFVGSAPVARSVMSVAGRDMDREPVVGMGVSVPPQRESVMGQQLQPNAPVRRPPANVAGRSVFSRTPPAAAPEPFVPGRVPQAQPGNTQAPQRNPQAQGGQAPGRSGLTVVTPSARGRTPSTQDDRQQTAPGRTPSKQDDRQQTAPGRTPSTQDDRQQTAPGRTPSKQDDRQQTAPGRTPSTQDDRQQTAPGRTQTAPDQSQARNLITTLKTQTLPQVEAKLNTARANKNAKLDNSSLSKQIESARAMLADAEKDLQAGRTDQAMQKAQNAQKQLAQIQQVIDNAMKSAGGGSTGRTGQTGKAPAAPSRKQ